jgi:hypothetical protein
MGVKRVVELSDVSGLEVLLGESVLLMCANYFYTGKLTAVDVSVVELTEPGIVYETGAWSDKSYADVQKLSAKKWYVNVSAIESYGLSK